MKILPKRIAMGSPPEKWELIKDIRLKPGEMRYECGGGGIFFSGSDRVLKTGSLVEKGRRGQFR